MDLSIIYLIMYEKVIKFIPLGSLIFFWGLSVHYILSFLVKIIFVSYKIMHLDVQRWIRII